MLGFGKEGNKTTKDVCCFRNAALFNEQSIEYIRYIIQRKLEPKLGRDEARK